MKIDTVCIFHLNIKVNSNIFYMQQIIILKEPFFNQIKFMVDCYWPSIFIK